MLLPTTMHLILELWGYFIHLNINLIYEKDNCIDIVRGPKLQLTDTNHWNPVKSKSTNNVTYHKNRLSQHRRKLISGAVLASVPDSDKQLLVWTGSSASEATKQTRYFNLVDVLSICIYNNRKTQTLYHLYWWYIQYTYARFIQNFTDIWSSILFFNINCAQWNVIPLTNNVIPLEHGLLLPKNTNTPRFTCDVHLIKQSIVFEDDGLTFHS